MTTIATLVKRFALWKAQDGATIAQLEQLQASTSLPSTIKMVFLLRAINWMSLALIFIWAWYYLASQAAQREYTYQTSDKYHQSNLTYGNPKAPSAFLRNLTDVELANINAAFLFAGIGHNPINGADINGAPLIPLLKQGQPLLLGPVKKGGWQDIYYIDLMQYSSAVGLPAFYTHNEDLVGVRFVGPYTLSASYIYANCTSFETTNILGFPSNVPATMSNAFTILNATSNGFPQVDFWARVSNSSLHSTCVLERQAVDVKGACDISLCVLKQIRPNVKTPSPTPATEFLDAGFATRFFNGMLFSQGTPVSLDEATVVKSSSKAVFRNGAWTTIDALSYADTNGTNYNNGQLSQERMNLYSLSLGITQLVNTYMTASQPVGSLSKPNELLYDNAAMASGIANGTITNTTYWLTASANISPFDPRYYLSVPWIVVDLMTCLILLASAIASCWLRQRTVAPDIFGYVSSMTRDNPHMHLPDGGSTMSGVERAKALRNVKVMVADLNGGNGVGHIGLVAKHPDVAAAKIEKGGRYI
jgi:hypothetical protein